MKKLFAFLAAAALIASCKGGAGGGSDSYFPTTTGTTWTYGGSRNYVMTVANDTTVSGKKYVRVKQDSSDMFFIRNDGGAVYASAPQLNWQEAILFKNGDKGSNWNYAFSMMGMNIKYADTIVETGMKLNVAGKDYSDVIHVRDVQSGDSTVPGKVTERYFAKGIGMIQETSTGDTSRLMSYTIK